MQYPFRCTLQCKENISKTNRTGQQKEAYFDTCRHVLKRVSALLFRISLIGWIECCKTATYFEFKFLRETFRGSHILQPLKKKSFLTGGWTQSRIVLVWWWRFAKEKRGKKNWNWSEHRDEQAVMPCQGRCQTFVPCRPLFRFSPFFFICLSFAFHVDIVCFRFISVFLFWGFIRTKSNVNFKGCRRSEFVRKNTQKEKKRKRLKCRMLAFRRNALVYYRGRKFRVCPITRNNGEYRRGKTSIVSVQFPRGGVIASVGFVLLSSFCCSCFLF